MSGEASASASETGGVPTATDEPQRARKKLRRTTFACYRCHRRKIKCDGLKPTCGACVQAKQPCHGILDGESKTVIPRSIAAYLREKIAEKERFLQKLGVDVDDGLTEPLLPRTRLDLTSQGSVELDTRYQKYDLASEAFRSFGESCKPIIDTKFQFPFATFLFASSHLPSADPLPVNDEVREDDLKPKSNALDQIPQHIQERLVALYTDRILPLYPFVDRQRIWNQYHRTSGQSCQPPSEYDVFTISMVIAISMMTSKVNDSEKIASVSQRVFSHALQHTESLFEPSLENVQAMLFFAQYSFLMPSIARAWDTIGLAMRMALELGLHRDPEETGHEDREQRRCSFWVLYIYDRSTCATSHRRLGVADDSISTKYPTNMEGSFLVNNIRFRRIQSELWTVNYLRRGLPLLTEPGSYESWMQSTENRIKAWKLEVVPEKSSWDSEWFSIAAAHGLVCLHRPTPRNPHPSAESLVKCFDAGTEVALGYGNNIRRGFLKYSYHSVHHGFEASICCLFAIRHCREQLTARYGMQRVLDILHSFSRLLALTSERWRQAHASLEAYERCKAVVIRELMSPQATPPVKNDELDRLILPYQALINQAEGQPELSGPTKLPGIGAGYTTTTTPFGSQPDLAGPRLTNQQVEYAQTLAPFDGITAANTLPSMQSSLPPTPEFLPSMHFPVKTTLTPEGLLNQNMNWDETFMQPDGSVDGVILWSM
ncbi:fungal-specific transcription factor domain-containing protein [Phyllosticta capitalensis]